MKKSYPAPQMEIDLFEEDDIICASGGVTITDGNLDEGEGELDD